MIFESLLKRVFRKPEPPKPFSVEEIRKLGNLRHSEGWPIFLRTLDTMTKFNAEALLSPAASAVDFTRGYIAGLRKAGTLVDEIIQRYDTERQSAEPRRADTAAAIVYGTPFA